MAFEPFNKVALIGLGLIGSSLSHVMRREGLAGTISTIISVKVLALSCAACAFALYVSALPGSASASASVIRTSQAEPFDELVAHASVEDVAAPISFAELVSRASSRLGGVLGVKPEDLRPWHYADPFAQEAPTLSEFDLDTLYEDKDLLDIATGLCRLMTAYDRMGIFSFNMNFFTGAPSDDLCVIVVAVGRRPGNQREVQRGALGRRAADGAGLCRPRGGGGAPHPLGLLRARLRRLAAGAASRGARGLGRRGARGVAI